MEDVKKITEAANALAEKNDYDVLLYNGDIDRVKTDQVLDACAAQLRRKQVFLILCTRGGDPDAAYRLGRRLQTHYKRVIVAICGRCKSAGALIALGAHELVMTDNAELGPLDIQLGKKDELFEMDSGLTVLNALTQLEEKAFNLFEDAFIRLKVRSEGRISLRMATEIAAELAKGMMAPIMSQIDPLHLGEVCRAMEISKEYGSRLSKETNNLKANALDRLINSYPSHGFVIDRKEAEELFQNIRQPSAEELQLLEMIGAAAVNPLGKREGFGFFVSDRKQEAANDTNSTSGTGEQVAKGTARDGANPEIGANPHEANGNAREASRPRAVRTAS